MSGPAVQRKFEPGEFRRVRCDMCAALCVPRDVGPYTQPGIIEARMSGIVTAIPVALLCLPCALVAVEAGQAVPLFFPTT